MAAEQNKARGDEERAEVEKRSFSASTAYWKILEALQDYWETDTQSQTLRRLLKYADKHILNDEDWGSGRSRRK